MYLCTKFQKVKNKIIDMVFSNKPLQFIIAILFACLPIIGFANTSTDVLPVKSELKDVKTKVLSEAEILKEKIDEKKAHHVLEYATTQGYGQASR